MSRCTGALNPQLAVDFMVDRNVMSQATAASGTLNNRNNVAVAYDDGLTAFKQTKAERETS
jgi:hypothetical protein